MKIVDNWIEKVYFCYPFVTEEKEVRHDVHKGFSAYQKKEIVERKCFPVS